MNKLAILISIVCSINAFALKLPNGISMGQSPKDWTSSSSDISNPESWEEIRYKLNAKIEVYGITSENTEIAFWNNRLYEVKVTLPLERWDEIRSNLTKDYGNPYTIDTLKEERSGSWYENDKNSIYVYQIIGVGTVVTFTDDAQKEFHYSDLFHGVLLYIFLTIFGLFFINWLFAKLINSYCKSCKTFNMKYQQVIIDNQKDYSTELFKRDYHHDTTYVFKCKKCGNVRKDRYSGFWSYMRNKN